MNKENAFNILDKLYETEEKLNNSISLNFELLPKDGQDPEDLSSWTVAVSHISGNMKDVPEEVQKYLAVLTTGLRHGYEAHQDVVYEWAFHELAPKSTAEDADTRVIN